MAEEDTNRPDPTSRDYRLNDFQDNMVVVSYNSWIVIATFIAFMFIVGLWTVFGSISIQVMGKGIALTTEGVLGLPSKVEGRIMDLRVMPGQIVEKGDTIATIYDLQHEVELKNSQKKLEILEKDYLDAKIMNQEELGRRITTLKSDSKATLFEIEQRTENLPGLEKDLKSKKKLYKEGLISALMLQNAEVELMEEEITIQNLQVKLKKNEEELKQSYKSDELKNYKRFYYDAFNDVTELEAKSSYFKILSPIKGRILELQVRIGEEVKEGQSIVLMEKTFEEDKDYIFYCYTSSNDGSKVKVGTDAYIELSLVDSQKYGYLEGVVTAVSHYPVSDSHIYSIVHSEELVEFLKASHDAVIEIIVKPEKDASTPSGFRWTSGKGPDIHIHTGLLATLRLTVEKRRPISYLFPEWWLPGGKGNKAEMNTSKP